MDNVLAPEIIQAFTNYLNRPDITGKIQELLNNNRTRLTLNLDHMKQYASNLLPILVKRPIPSLTVLENALQTIIDGMNNDMNNNKKRRQGDVTQKRPHYTFAFEGNFGRNHITPRGLTSQTINQLVAVNGIVTRMSIVRPKLIHSVHYCEATKIGTVKEYYDQFNLTADKTLQTQSTAFPRKDDHNNPLTTEYGFCKYKDHQTLVVQEMPEKAPTGMMPHSVEVVLEDDLVDKVKPGDRIMVVGIYKAITNANSLSNGIFKGALVATNINVLATDVDTPSIAPEDVRSIKKISERKDLFEILARSVAPSIFGHLHIKKAILLMLLGGVEKILENKTHLRGDINVLMMGDPSTAKSQLLRRVLTIAPLAINTTGRGSSGVGLTAAVTLDKDTGEKHLEAGAMVLADRGVVCIDEFDKMEEADRVAIHEVMEQQTVTIAKAGIHTTLNARCSVIAAANPIYGEYQKDLPPTKNIGLPDSLLSRFDFIFIVLDEKNSEIDRLIAERVTKNHRYITPGQEDNLVLFDHSDDFIIEPDINEKDTNEIFEKYNATIHDSDSRELLTLRFLKKYIFFAKKTIVPQMRDEAVDFISNAWTELRQKDNEDVVGAPKTMTITIRTLETLIRIATAHAKMRLSKEVEVKDCEAALDLLNYALFNERKDVD
jgi:DNA replication licensing factor MCM3